MKKTVLELLKVRKIENSLDFIDYSFKIPPIFKTFLETYEIPQDGLIGGKEVEVFNPLFNSLDSLGFYEYIPQVNVGLSYFLKIADAPSIMERCFDKTDPIFTMNLIPIAQSFSQEIIMLGIGKDNADKIFLETNLSNDYPVGERIIFLSNNIFEFLRGFEWSLNESYVERNFKTTDKLYRNWGEDFWRVREE